MKKYFLVLLFFIFILPKDVFALSITLGWDKGSDANGYKIYYGTESGKYTQIIDVGYVNIYTLQGFEYNIVYYFAVTAYNENGESDYSKEVFSSYNNLFVYKGAYICEAVTQGSQNYWDLQPVNPKNIFNLGENIYLLAKANVSVSHRWKMSLYFNENFWWDDETDWKSPSEFSNYTPYQNGKDTFPGSYKFEIYIDTGEGFKLLETKIFEVKDSDENIGYIYKGSYLCESILPGQNDYWDFQPLNPKTNFSVGEKVQLLVKLKDITVDHRYKLEVMRNGVYWWSNIASWNYVLTKWGYGNYTPYQMNSPAGTYKFRIFIQTEKTTEYILLSELDITVQ